MSHKLQNFLLMILYIFLYSGFTVAVLVHVKWAYVLILLSTLVGLLLLWNEEVNIVKVWAILMIPYSLLVLFGLNAEFLVEKYPNNVALIVLFTLAEMLAIFSYKVVAMVLICLIPFLPFLGELSKDLVKGFKRRLNDKIYGEFPNVKGITKRDKKIYFQIDYEKQEYQLIYRQEHRKRVLGIFTYKSEWEHFSLEWENKDFVVVRQYDNLQHKEIMKQEIRLPRNKC